MADEKPEENKSEETGALKIDVRSTPMIKKDEPTEATNSNLTSHRGVMIKPLGDQAEVETEEKTKEPEPEPEKEPAEQDTKSTPEPVEPEKAAAPVSPTPPTDDAPKTEPNSSIDQTTVKNESSDAKALEDKELQSPKVFDTKQYHLPIDEGAAGGTGKKIMMFVVVLLIAIGGVVALDAGWVDVGLKLPFDLIK